MLLSFESQDLASPDSQNSSSLRYRTVSFTQNQEMQQNSWYYHPTEIALRRIGNRILNAFYRHDNYPVLPMPVPAMINVARDFEN